jgi:hypothetical protein
MVSTAKSVKATRIAREPVVKKKGRKTEEKPYKCGPADATALWVTDVLDQGCCICTKNLQRPRSKQGCNVLG